MKLSGWQWIALGSLLFAAVAAAGETRPQYGGTLHVVMRFAPASLDPADRSFPDSTDRRNLTALIFDTLVALDDSGSPRGFLAQSWERVEQRWQFRIRQGVKFQDGAPLTAEAVAASLRFANPQWNVIAAGDTVSIDRNEPETEMLAELTLPRNAIVKRDSENKLSGTGPFRIADWEPGKHVTLEAQEDCWQGRPFLDTIEVEIGKSFHDQALALQSGKAELAEVAPEQVRRFSQEARRLESSGRIELLAIVFAREVTSPEEKLLREALALSVVRTSIRDVLLQGSGEPAGGLLPTWISGYGFVFSSDAELVKAREVRNQARSVLKWKLQYESDDPLARLIAERIALNARDAGLSVEPTTAGNPDMQVMRIPLMSLDPWIALEELCARFGLPAVKNKDDSLASLLANEQRLLASERLIPLIHVPVFYAASVSLKNWKARKDGSWNLSNAWLESPKQ